MVMKRKKVKGDSNLRRKKKMKPRIFLNILIFKILQ